MSAVGTRVIAEVRRKHRLATLATSRHTYETLVRVAAIQTPDQFQSFLTRLEGQFISMLQVLGVNSLKPIAPMPEAVVRDMVASASLNDRLVTIATPHHRGVSTFSGPANLCG